MYWSRCDHVCSLHQDVPEYLYLLEHHRLRPHDSAQSHTEHGRYGVSVWCLLDDDRALRDIQRNLGPGDLRMGLRCNHCFLSLEKLQGRAGATEEVFREFRISAQSSCANLDGAMKQSSRLDISVLTSFAGRSLIFLPQLEGMKAFCV